LVFAVTLSLGIYYSKIKDTDTLGEHKDSLANVTGIIIPHHDLANSLIIDSFQKLKENNEYTKIVVIGPNHFYPESPTIMTSYSLKDYPVDKSSVRMLENLGKDVLINQEKLENEHSIGIPIKYLSKIYPDAKFIPLAVSPFYTDDILTKVSNLLAVDVDNTLFVLSIDFSHNLGIDEALKNNETSIDAIRNFDTQKILSFNDEYLDSPVSTVLFLDIMKILKAESWATLYSTHGSVIVGQPDLNGTSYVVGVFSK